MKTKILIIGAGPAGIATALTLNKLGISDLLIIEKAKFPRSKCCAGYITNKTKKKYEELGLNIKKCHYFLIKNFNIFYKLKFKQNILNKFLYTNITIDRVELDNEFFKLAKSKKINILEHTSIKQHNKEENYIITSTNEKINYEFIVFADGTNSYGNKYQTIAKKNIAMQLLFTSNKTEEIQIHFGVTKKGYGWVSSYNGITNVGLTDIYDKNKNYKLIFDKFLKDLNLNVDSTSLKGAYTPIGVRKPIISNMYYVGDAVGACDPLTLSGLRYALNSGEYCAKAISENNNNIYFKYIKKLKSRFKFMYFLSKIFYIKSTLFCVFEIGCRFFKRIISYVFNHFFVSKK